MFPLLEFMDKQELVSYTSEEIARIRLQLLGPTHMVDYAMDITKTLSNDESKLAEMEQQKSTIFQQLEDLTARSEPLKKLFADSDAKAALLQENQWNVRGIAHIASHDTIETYRQLAKFNYDCGDYKAARDMLNNYISLFVSYKDKEDYSNNNSILYDPSSFHNVGPDLLQVLWGRLSCEILILEESLTAVISALNVVRSVLESLASSHKISSLEALRQRTWLLHWSLFVYCSNGTRKGMDQLLDLYTSEKYLQAITGNAPHLIRYLTASVLLTKRKSGSHGNKMMRELLRVLQHCVECHALQDPIIEFITSLCIQYDFEGAQAKLASCAEVLKTDFFLHKQADLFMEEARIFIFENYCRIHSKLRLSDLADMLAMDAQTAERWIVDLIRNTDLSAKIDLKENCVVMRSGTKGSGSRSSSVYQVVLDRTKDLNIRSSLIVQNLKAGIEAAEKESKMAECDD